MSYVLFTPPTVDVGLVREHQRPPERAIARIVGPMPTGGSLLRIGGVWSFVRHPSQDQINSVDLDTEAEGAPPFLYQGGHWYYVRQSIYDELTEAGFEVPTFQGPHSGLFPSDTTYPGDGVLPGD